MLNKVLAKDWVGTDIIESCILRWVSTHEIEQSFSGNCDVTDPSRRTLSKLFMQSLTFTKVYQPSETPMGE